MLPRDSGRRATSSTLFPALLVGVAGPATSTPHASLHLPTPFRRAPLLPAPRRRPPLRAAPLGAPPPPQATLDGPRPAAPARTATHSAASCTAARFRARRRMGPCFVSGGGAAPRGAPCRLRTQARQQARHCAGRERSPPPPTAPTLSARRPGTREGSRMNLVAMAPTHDRAAAPISTPAPLYASGPIAQ